MPTVLFRYLPAISLGLTAAIFTYYFFGYFSQSDSVMANSSILMPFVSFLVTLVLSVSQPERFMKWILGLISLYSFFWALGNLVYTYLPYGDPQQGLIPADYIFYLGYFFALAAGTMALTGFVRKNNPEDLPLFLILGLVSATLIPVAFHYTRGISGFEASGTAYQKFSYFLDTGMLIPNTMAALFFAFSAAWSPGRWKAGIFMLLALSTLGNAVADAGYAVTRDSWDYGHWTDIVWMIQLSLPALTALLPMEKEYGSSAKSSDRKGGAHEQTLSV